MQANNSKNLLKKALIIAGITSAGLLLSFPTLASELAQSSGSGSNNRSNSVDRNNVDTGDRNTSPEVNREENRPGTGTESDTRQNLTGPDDGGSPRIYQNRTNNQNYPNNTPNNTNNTNNNYNRSNPTDNQNIRNNSNTDPQSGNQLNNRSYNNDGSNTGPVQGLW